jgi:hypothetical protein
MTRQEAIKTLEKAQAETKGASWAERNIDMMVSLGILKLDEPINPEMRAGEIIAAYVTGEDTAAILMELHDAGLVVVCADAPIGEP